MLIFLGDVAICLKCGDQTLDKDILVVDGCFKV